MYLGTNKGLFFLNNKQFIPAPDLHATSISCLLKDSKGGLWAGTPDGLYYRPKKQSKWLVFKHDPLKANSLTDNEIRCLFEDQQGNLWIGTGNGGLNRLNVYQSNFFRRFDRKSFGISSGKLVVFSVKKSLDGSKIWAGSSEGLFCFDYKSGKRLWHLRDALLRPEVMAVNELENGQLYLGHNLPLKSLSVVDGRNGKVLPPLNFSNPAQGPIRGFCQSKAGLFFYGQNGFRKVAWEEHERPGYLANISSLSLSRKGYGYLWDAAPVDSCRYWLASNGGLVLFDWCNEKILLSHALDSNSHYGTNAILCLLVQSDSCLWMGSWGGGLFKWNPLNGDLEHYGRTDGLLSTEVYGILEDENRLLWLSTNQGVFRFDPKKRRFTHFGQEDGLISGEFASGAYCKTADGEMFFGGRDGFVSFFPEDIQKTPRQASEQLTITDIQLSGITWQGDTNIEALRHISFLYRPQQSLEISFSDFDFHTGDPPQFHHRLLGFETEWNKPSAKPFIRYTNLPPGDYDFELERADLDLGQKAPRRHLRIQIRPQLHQRLWFQIAAGLLLLLGIAAIVFFRLSTGQNIGKFI
ncbi:MAG: two-component regulator propeller domain-containing protein [Bacteroidia bacterium]